MWAQIVVTLLGIWSLASPAVLGFDGALRTSNQIVGPLVASFACIAIAECTRAVRWANVPLGAWIVIAPWILGGTPAATVDALLTGGAVIALSLVRGKIRREYGGGWSSLWGGADSSSSPGKAC